MITYKYKTKIQKLNKLLTDDYLNECGKDGWELIFFSCW